MLMRRKHRNTRPLTRDDDIRRAAVAAGNSQEGQEERQFRDDFGERLEANLEALDAKEVKASETRTKLDPYLLELNRRINEVAASTGDW